jgi:hypothetical protein
VQVEIPAGERHELPEANGAGAGYGPGVQAGLNNGKVFKFIGQVVLPKVFFKQREIQILSPQHKAGVLAVADGEEVNETMNSVVVRKGDGILYAGQAVSNKFRCFLCRDVLKLHGYRKQCRIGQ